MEMRDDTTKVRIYKNVYQGLDKEIQKALSSDAKEMPVKGSYPADFKRGQNAGFV